jgi:hypothetical protein
VIQPRKSQNCSVANSLCKFENRFKIHYAEFEKVAISIGCFLTRDHPPQNSRKKKNTVIIAVVKTWSSLHTEKNQNCKKENDDDPSSKFAFRNAFSRIRLPQSRFKSRLLVRHFSVLHLPLHTPGSSRLKASFSKSAWEG